MTFPNWFNYVEPFFSRNLPKDLPLRVLQIGAYTGDATAWLLENREIEFIDDVDTWGGSEEASHESIDFGAVEDYYDSRFEDNPKVTKFKMTSDNFFPAGSGARYNFIYIDGDHTALQTALDGLNAFKMLEYGGIMAFDDYQWNYNGNPFLEPKRGVDAFLSVCDGNYALLDSGYQIWIKKC